MKVEKRFAILSAICGILSFVDQYFLGSKILNSISIPSTLPIGLFFILLAIFTSFLIFFSKKNVSSQNQEANEEKNTSDPFVVRTGVQLSGVGSQPKDIKVCRLLQRETEIKPWIPLELSPNIFVTGLELLYEQITGGNPCVDYDAIIGIRHVGLSMASLIAGMLRAGDKMPIGFIYPNSSYEPKLKVLPEPSELGPNPKILITDGEIKRGDALFKLKNELTKIYENPIIHSAILCASEIKGTISNIEDLRDIKYRTSPFINKLENLHENEWQKMLSNMPLPTWLAFIYDGTIKLKIKERIN